MENVQARLQPQYKIFVSLYFKILMGGLILVVLMNFCCDPLQYYRHSPDKKLNGNDRWQVAGFIRTYDFEQIVLGTSMTQNFSLEQLKKEMKMKPIRLSVAGSTIQEQSIILRAAIKTGKVKSVIWGIDRGYLKYTKGKVAPTFPKELYEQTYLGHLNYLMNLNTVSSSIKYLSRFKQKEMSDYEHYNAWYQEAEFSKEIVLKLFNDSIKGFAQNQALDKIKITLNEDEREFYQTMNGQIHNFEQDVFTIIKQNPQIEFHLFFPPYSLAYYKLHYYAATKIFTLDAGLRKYMLLQLSLLPNVYLYDFETNIGIIANLDNYKDLTHYSGEISDLMIHSFSKKQNLWKRENLEKNHQAFISLPTHQFK